MALGKIYIGNNLYVDGKAIANAIGSEAATAVTFAALTSLITGNKTSLANALTTKGVSANATETMSALVAKINEITSSEPTAIINAIGNELASNASMNQVANAITGDKQNLINMLLDFGIPCSMNDSLALLITKFNGVVATRFRYATDSLADVSFVNSMQEILDTLVTLLVTTDIKPLSDSMADVSFIDSINMLDSLSYMLMTILTNQMTSDTTGILPPIVSDLIPAMTSNTSSIGTASALNHYNAPNLPDYYQPYKAFDGKFDGDSAGSLGYVTLVNTVSGWLQFQFNTPAVVKQYNVIGWSYTTLAVDATAYPKDWTFEGSNDGSTWDILDTQVNQSVTIISQVNSYPINNTIEYAYYRLNFTSNNGDGSYTAIGQLVLLNTPALGVSGTCSASSVYDSSYDAWKAFNRTLIDANDAWITIWMTLTGWLKYNFPSPKIVNIYELYPRNVGASGIDSFPKDWTFEGSNDDTIWDVLDTETNQSVSAGSYKQYIIDNTTAYSYYRINITANNGNTGTTSIGEMRLIQTQ